MQIECKTSANQMKIECLLNSHSDFQSDYKLNTTDYAAYFATPHSFLSILCYKVLSKLSNSTNIVFVGSSGEVMLSGVDSLNVIIFYAILIFLLDADISQNKYS